MTLDDALAELDSLVGLDTVKQAVRGIAHAQQANIVREKQGLPTLPLGLNLAFTGSPGTGKTTVGRIVGEIYRSLGILHRGNFVEVTRIDLSRATSDGPLLAFARSHAKRLAEFCSSTRPTP